MYKENCGCNKWKCGLDYFYSLLTEVNKLRGEGGCNCDNTVGAYYDEAIRLVIEAIKVQKNGNMVRNKANNIEAEAFDWYDCNVACDECKALECEINKILDEMAELEDCGLELIMQGLGKWQRARALKLQKYDCLQEKYIECADSTIKHGCSSCCNTTCNTCHDDCCNSRCEEEYRQGRIYKDRH